MVTVVESLFSRHLKVMATRCPEIQHRCDDVVERVYESSSAESGNDTPRQVLIEPGWSETSKFKPWIAAQRSAVHPR